VANGKKKSKTIDVPCPECDNFVKVTKFAREGQQFACSACGNILEVVSVDPLELDIVLNSNLRRKRTNYAFN